MAISDRAETAIVHSKAFVPFAKSEIEQSIPQRFEQHVKNTPTHIAVKSETEALTYEKLHSTSNQLAHVILDHLGISEGSVALFIEQGAPLIAAILGVLKTGKIYVPLDPSYPRVRLQYMLDDSGADLILTDEKNVALTATFVDGNRRVVNIDRLDSHRSTSDISIPLTPDTLAYIFYTSGSTGKPKGVVDNHRNILHNIMRYTNNLKISPDDKLSLLQSCSFSGSVSSLFCALLNGATVFPYDVQKEGFTKISDWLNNEKITIYHSVPMIFRSFLDGNISFPHVRVVRLEGDRASKLDVELYKQYFSDECVLVNGLGATETGISRQYFMMKSTKLFSSIVPIGYATEDMESLIIDDDGKQHEPKAIGEIAIRSKYLAVGYWRNPDMTSATFTADPNGGDQRVYRTGDMGRMLPDGCLEYLGRKDFGMKIRGQRVEAAEVEKALLNLASVKETVVVMRDDQNGEPLLIAYLVPATKTPPSAIDLRKELSEVLPDFMIPSRFVLMDSLPVNSNNKVDRSVLPDPDTNQRADSEQPIEPRTTIERQLQMIWEDILNVQPICVRDNFFDLGGNSLLVARLFARIKSTLGKHLALSVIFEAPTIEQLARMIGNGNTMVSTSLLVPLRSQGQRPPLYCVHDSHGDPFLYLDLAKYLGNDQPVYGIQSPAFLGEKSLPPSMQELARRYVNEIQRVQPLGPYYLCASCYGGVIAFEMAQQLLSRGNKIGLLAILDFTPADLPFLVSSKASSRFKQYQRWNQLKTIRQELSTRNVLHWPSYAFDKIRKIMGHTSSAVPALSLDSSVTLEELRNYHQRILRRYSARPYEGTVYIFLWNDILNLIVNKAGAEWSGAIRRVVACDVPGASGWMMREPNVYMIANRLRDCMNSSFVEGKI